MSHIEAIYRGGVFEPLGPVDLSEDQRVHLSFEPANGQAWLDWLEQVRAAQTEILAKNRILPDSATDIAADRRR
ncbi:MAG TPA: antitoxin family protein [Lacipirellulaceae bacterium]|nr:antitoxin family protein [Lacipirellulaceae bacterium]